MKIYFSKSPVPYLLCPLTLPSPNQHPRLILITHSFVYRRVISGSRDASLRVWDVQRGRCLSVLQGHVAAVRCVQYDGGRAVSGAYDYTVKIWDVLTAQCLHTLTGHTNRVYSLQVCSERDSEKILSGRGERRVLGEVYRER